MHKGKHESIQALALLFAQLLGHRAVDVVAGHRLGVIEGIPNRGRFGGLNRRPVHGPADDLLEL